MLTAGIKESSTLVACSTGSTDKKVKEQRYWKFSCKTLRERKKGSYALRSLTNSDQAPLEIIRHTTQKEQTKVGVLQDTLDKR